MASIIANRIRGDAMVKKKILLFMTCSFLFGFFEKANCLDVDILKDPKILTLSFFSNSQSSRKQKDSNVLISISMLDKIVNFFNKVILGEGEPETRTLAFLDILSNLKKYLFVAQNSSSKDHFVEEACKYINIQYHNMVIMKSIVEEDAEISGDHSFEFFGLEQITSKDSKLVKEKANILIKNLSNVFLPKNAGCNININFTPSQAVSNELMQAMVSRGEPSDQEYLAINISKNLNNYSVNIILGSTLFEAINSEDFSEKDSLELSLKIDKLAKQAFYKFALKSIFLNPVTNLMMDSKVTEDFLNNYSSQLLEKQFGQSSKLIFEAIPLPNWQHKIVSRVCSYYENPFATNINTSTPKSLTSKAILNPSTSSIFGKKPAAEENLWNWDEEESIDQRKLEQIREQVKKATDSLSESSKKDIIKTLGELETLFTRPKNLEDILEQTIFGVAYSSNLGTNEFLQKKSKSKLQTFLSGLISLSSPIDIPKTPSFSIDFIHRKEEPILGKHLLQAVIEHGLRDTEIAKLGLPFNGRIILFQLISDLATIVNSLEKSSLSINFLIVYSKILDLIKSAELKIGSSKKKPTWAKFNSDLYQVGCAQQKSVTVEGFFTKNFGLRKIRLFSAAVAKSEEAGSTNFNSPGNFSWSNSGKETRDGEIISSSLFDLKTRPRSTSIQRRTVLPRARR